ncbi:MAG: lipocalin-like domain-containing protein [Deltaproteobacteria bacterium]|jgi:hypothetical protein|nr:lipocalin-like domain-containing protein [Deltaproteobacteria bacterium]MBW2496155.1 lipocalin-like domain-containing protein [Deltaproteobacteria bacterium]
MDARSGLIGSWRLVSFELEGTDGSISHPYGEELMGYLFYNEDGYMSSAFMSADRANAQGTDLSEAGRSNTYDQFMAYCGGYTVDGDKIRHRVEVSSLAVWNGTIQERWFKLDGDRLELLTAPLSVGSEAPVGRLVWERSTQAVLPS